MTTYTKINLILLALSIKKSWKFWLSNGIISAGISCIFIIYTPHEYRASSTFFIPNQSPLPASFSHSSITKDHILTIFNSSKIKRDISKSIIKKHPELFTAFKKKHPEVVTTTPTHMLSVFEKLELRLTEKTRLYKNENDLFKLYYDHKTPKIALSVIHETLNQLINIAHQINISSNKNIITIVDKPKQHLSPIHPQKTIILAFSFLAGTFLGISYIIVRNIFYNTNNQNYR